MKQEPVKFDYLYSLTFQSYRLSSCISTVKTPEENEKVGGHKLSEKERGTETTNQTKELSS